MVRALILALAFLNPVIASAYSAHSTHPALTQEIVEIFNAYNPEHTLSLKETAWVMEGATEEDAPATRVLNHFYDPIHRIGLLGANTPAKTWVVSTKLQAAWGGNLMAGVSAPLFSAASDYSWERNVYEYVHGDKERALRGLGHALHLIEDMAVPDHTRNDQHLSNIDDSPYEAWTEQFGPGLDTAEKLTREKKKPENYGSVEKYLEAMALYSNKNFFSKDTIFSYDYSSPNLKSLLLNEVRGEKFLLSNDKSGEPYFLVQFEESFDPKLNEPVRKYSIEDANKLVIHDYWTLLSEETVLNGAGVVSLFFSEVEKERQTLALLEKNKSIAQRAYEKAERKAIAAYEKTERAALAAYEKAKDAAAKTAGAVTNAARAVAATARSTVSLFAASQGAAVVTAPQATASANPPPPPPPQKPTPLPAPKPLPPTPIVEINSPSEIISPKLAYAAQIKKRHGGGGNDSVAVVEETTEFVPEVEEDTSAPQAPTLLAPACASSISPDTCLLLATTTSLASVSWSSDATDLSYFLFDDGTTSATTTATSVEFLLGTDATRSFRVVAVDTAGNESDSATITLRTVSKPVVINEVAWAGTENSANDEWIELLNTTNYEIDLAEWTLASADLAPSIPLSGAIPADGYFLLERTDDNTISDIAAGLIYTGALNNDGDQLTLSFGITIIDQTPVGEWPAGGASTKLSMERRWGASDGTLPTSWGSNVGFMRNGRDASAGYLGGTPKTKNSIGYLATESATLTENLSLPARPEPYVLGDLLIINASTTLAIEPGTTLAFYASDDRAGFIILRGGDFESLGTASSTSRITSFATLFPGVVDTAGVVPLEDVVGIFGSGADISIVYTDVEDLAGITAFGGTISIASSTITGSEEGISAFNATTTIENVVFADLSINALSVSGGSLTVSSSTFDTIGAEGGVVLSIRTNAVATLDRVVVENSADIAVVINNASTTITNSTFAGGDTGINATSHKSLTIASSTFSEFSDTAIRTASYGTTTITNTAITDNGTGVYAALGTTTISESMIAGNDVGVWQGGSATVDATENYWGDPSGPETPENPEGEGDSIIGDVDTEPFLTEEPPVGPTPEPAE